MLSLPGYQVVTQIYESGSSLIYRGSNSLDRQPVILKLLKPDYPTLAELSRYKQEYDITRCLNLEGAIAAYSLKH